MSPSNRPVDSIYQPTKIDIARQLIDKISIMFNPPSDYKATEHIVHLSAEIGFDTHNTPMEYIQHLSDEASWNHYKSTIQKKIAEHEKESKQIYKQLSELQYDDVLTAKQRLQKRELLENKYGELTETIGRLKKQSIICNNIDEFINNRSGQELFLAQEELHKYYPSYVELQERVKKNKDESDNKRLIGLVEGDHHLQGLLDTIMSLEKQQQYAGRHENKTLATVMEVTVSVTKVGANVVKVIKHSQDYIKHLHEIKKAHESLEATEKTTSALKESGEHLSTAAKVMASIPLVSQFLNGLSCLREAYVAFKNPETPQRKTKIGAALFGGLVSIGCGIVGSLLLASVGALATATAVFAAPIVLGALAIGISSVSLYRDGYILHQARMQVMRIEDEIKKMDDEFIRAKEIIISNHITHSPSEEQDTVSDNNSLKEIKHIQEEINQKRHALYMAKNHPDTELSEEERKKLISELSSDLTVLNRIRNEKIRKNTRLSEKLQSVFREDPRIARICMQKTNLSSSLQQLQLARSGAKRTVGLGILGVIGVSLALAAICLTGVGALVVGAIGAATLIGVTTKKLYDRFKSQPVHAEPVSGIKPVAHRSFLHTSELQIEKELLHDHHHEIAHALVHQSVQAQEATTMKHSIPSTASSKKSAAPVLQKEEKEGEGRSSYKPH